MKQAIIFDMDGTLFQTNLILEPALQATFDILREKGQWQGETPIEMYRQIMGVPLPVVWETLLPNHSQETRGESNIIFQEQLIEKIHQGRGALYDGTEHILRELSINYSLYIASNGQVEYLQAIVAKYRLHRWIEHIYSIQMINSGDKSELVKLVIAENGITKGAVVGDRYSDIKAAKDNGLVAIGCRFDFSQPAELAKADITIQNLIELRDIEVEALG
ncbi:HAD hydrolase-like protein [Psychrobacillus soli]|uniref:HAD family hydrolase n=1 Tax=Psychrobacillus soli TaxID=1543965 RepID=A0A544TFT7_9BACI|nr:HAD hydrolase-like protein [Psychrobacillus soli]TQR16290.1 HAD family hydrolase [Psychrobacillus soli]